MENNAINRPRSWNGKPLAGEWLVTVKIDGVRAIWHDELGWLSRAHKPLHNIPPWQQGSARDCEIFVGTFRDTIRATRTRLTRRDTPIIHPQHMYGLDQLDERLRWDTLTNPTTTDILAQLQHANDRGHEGIVLRQADRWIKVKPEETHDVIITGYAEGEGKHLGRLGYVVTDRGNVGAGLTEKEREILWAEAEAGRLVGQIIEVSCMQFTPMGQFRHPVFVRMRPDKLPDGIHPPVPLSYLAAIPQLGLMKDRRLLSPTAHMARPSSITADPTTAGHAGRQGASKLRRLLTETSSDVSCDSFQSSGEARWRGEEPWKPVES